MSIFIMQAREELHIFRQVKHVTSHSHPTSDAHTANYRKYVITTKN
jgi:hypothetical protein